MEFSSELELDIPNMCRVCLLQKEKLNNIYSNCIVEGYVISLPDIIRSCLDLNLQKDDKNLPKKICDQCKIQVINFYSFKEKSKKVEEALKNLLSGSRLIKEEEVEVDNKSSIIDEPAEYIEEEAIEENDNKEIESVTVKNVEPSVDFKYSNNVQDVEMITVKPTDDDIQQTVIECEEVMEDVQEIEEEEEDLGENIDESCDLLETCLKNLTASDESSEAVNNIPNACEICDKKFETVNNLKRHLDTHNGIFFKCRICPKMYAHQASRNRHMRVRHSKQVKLIMTQKDNPFQRNDPLNPPIKINPQDTSPKVIIATAPENLLNEKKPDIFVITEFNDEEIYVDDNEYLCMICATNFKTKKMFVIHAKYEHPDMFCSKCCKLFSSAAERNEHLSLEHHGNSKSTQIAYRNFCRFCQKKLKSVLELNTHKALHETLNKWNFLTPIVPFFTCYKCNIIFLTQQDLQKHNISKHGDSPKKFNVEDIECTDYQFLEDDDGALTAETNIHDEKPFGCGVCNVQLLNENEMQNHIIIHSTKLSCPFDECGCEYNSFSRLSLHIIHRHLNRDEFKCMHCGESYKTYDDLQNHLKKSCPERKYKCTHCEKSFFSIKALTIHLKTSMEKKAILCQICGKSFSHQGELKIHSRTHTGERPYQCNVCGKSYKTASMRTAHMDAHIQGKTFLCTLCDKKLQTRTSFRNHMRRHTEDKKHQCAICFKKFFTKYHVKLHTMKIHDNPKRLQNKNIGVTVKTGEQYKTVS